MSGIISNWLEMSGFKVLSCFTSLSFERPLPISLCLLSVNPREMGLNKNNEEVIDDIESNRDNSDTCFSNPAFRGSPPEPIELDDITTNLQIEQPEILNKSNVTHVVVHIDSDEIADDARGFTERRHSDIGNGLSNEREVHVSELSRFDSMSSMTSSLFLFNPIFEMSNLTGLNLECFENLRCNLLNDFAYG
jgi:hypothetical protein